MSKETWNIFSWNRIKMLKVKWWKWIINNLKEAKAIRNAQCMNQLCSCAKTILNIIFLNLHEIRSKNLHGIHFNSRRKNELPETGAENTAEGYRIYIWYEQTKSRFSLKYVLSRIFGNNKIRGIWKFYSFMARHKHVHLKMISWIVEFNELRLPEGQCEWMHCDRFRIVHSKWISFDKSMYPWIWYVKMGVNVIITCRCRNYHKNIHFRLAEGNHTKSHLKFQLKKS